MFMFLGQMGCEALNLLLKRWIKEERPKRIYHLLPPRPPHAALGREALSIKEGLWLIYEMGT